MSETNQFLDLREWLIVHYPNILKKYDIAEAQGGMITE